MNNNIGEAVLVGFFAAAVRDAGSTESSSGGYSGNGSGFVFVAHPVPPAPPVHEVQRMILVTAFGPYQHHRTNASGVLVESLRRDLPEELSDLRDRLAFEVLRCEEISRDLEHQSIETQLADLLARHRPTVCIHTGQAPTINEVTIEKLAINSFLDEIIDPGRPAAYWATLPGADALRDVLKREHIPAGYSFYCGQHQCNHILFSSLHFAALRGSSHQAGFIHIPLLPEQVTRDNRDGPYMPLEMSRKALALIIRHVADAPG